MSAAVAERLGTVRWRRTASRHGWTLGVYLLVLALLFYYASVIPVFTSFDIQTIFLGSLPLVFAAMGQAIVVISGGIDLSIGPLMVLINVSAATLMLDQGLWAALAIALGLVVVGAAAGAVTGTVIVVSRVPDIVITLAMLFFWAGLALRILPTPGGGAPTAFRELVTGRYLRDISEWIPNGLLLIVAVLLVVWLPLRRSRLSHALYAIGSDRQAAFLSGIDVSRTRVAAYALAGVFAALGGLALTATTGIGSAQGAQAGQLYTLNSVAAIVLGGVSLLGGRGGLLGPVAAAFVFPIINAILLFQGRDPNESAIIQGSLIVLIVMVAGLLVRRER